MASKKVVVPKNQLCSWTMQKIEIALRDQGLDVIAGDLKGWHRKFVSDPGEDQQWDCYEGRVRKMTISITLQA